MQRVSQKIVVMMVSDVREEKGVQGCICFGHRAPLVHHLALNSQWCCKIMQMAQSEDCGDDGEVREEKVLRGAFALATRAPLVHHLAGHGQRCCKDTQDRRTDR